MAQPKELNFNEIEKEQLIDLFEDDDETDAGISKPCSCGKYTSSSSRQ